MYARNEQLWNNYQYCTLSNYIPVCNLTMTYENLIYTFHTWIKSVTS